MTPRPVQAASAWIYGGVWRVLVDWFRVPAEAPTLPAFAGESIAAFRPSEGYLRYLKLVFWIVLAIVDTALLVVWLVILSVSPFVGAVLALPIWALIILPDVVAYIAIHLLYDTTWYVLSERSMRIRRGVWTIRETTITYENVQNLRIDEGPLQRYFGIGNLVVETAGGGGGGGHGEGQPGTAGHHGLIEGVDNAREIRDLILAQLRKSTTGGLGDDPHPTTESSATRSWSSAQLATLREIRNLARRAAAS
jgi:membrane protein YdbS with pleckstrin-like domain